MAIAAGCGALAACLYLAVLLGSSGAVILVYLTQLPLYLAGLWLGAGAAAVAGTAATLIMLLASDLIAAALFVGLNAVPVTLLTRQALLARQAEDGTVHWYPLGLLTAWLTAYALAGIVFALLTLGGVEGVQAGLRTIIAPALDRITGQPLIDRDEIAASLAMVIPGVVAASWMVMAIINASLAQGLLARFAVNWRPSPDIAGLGLPGWMPILLGLAAAATAFGGASRFLGVNAMIALAVPFCLAGLAVLHVAVRRLSHPAMLLITFYTMAALFGWPLFVVAVVGLFESWLGLRRRLAPPGGRFDG